MTPSLDVHTGTIMEQDAACDTQYRSMYMLESIFDNIEVLSHTIYARSSPVHNAGLLILILSNHTGLCRNSEA